ncbi:MAG: hypothetical protein E6356_13750 [Terrisporobacter othiniensis]|nr:hypothetical protein [Terrisporobacter othiniensis]
MFKIFYLTNISVIVLSFIIASNRIQKDNEVRHITDSNIVVPVPLILLPCLNLFIGVNYFLVGLGNDDVIRRSNNCYNDFISNTFFNAISITMKIK